jgi:hypothetical protein
VINVKITFRVIAIFVLIAKNNFAAIALNLFKNRALSSRKIQKITLKIFITKKANLFLSQNK